MQTPDVDRNVQYLVLTLVIIVAVVGYHNYTTGQEDLMSFGMCDQSIQCQGFQSGGVCIGIEQPSITCMDPGEAPAWRRAEVECGLDAQGLCNADPTLTGTEWTQNPNATWDGQRCTAWAEQNAEFDLLTCEQTFNDISQWSGESG